MTIRVLSLLLIWLTLFRDVTPGLVLGGLIVGLAASVLIPGPKGLTWRWWWVPRLVFDELIGVLHATVVVLRVLVRPGAPEPGIVDVSLPGGARETALLGGLLTLTPGTYVVDMADDGSWLQLHLMDVRLAETLMDDVRRLHRDVRAVTDGPTGPIPDAHASILLDTDPEVLR
jgi:multisubunit Na+/H+ antiporter MnhE subunit